MATAAILVRDAPPDDLATIVDFNARLAAETEGKDLDPTSSPGASRPRWPIPTGSATGSPSVDGRGRRPGGHHPRVERLAGRLDLVAPERLRRPRGHAARASSARLYGHIRDAARAEPDVIGLRLYVEHENERAQPTYRALGMRPGGYHVYEELWPERFS